MRFLPGLLAASLTFAFASAQAQTNKDPFAGETKAHRDARMHWWREARFGMFIHWGLYAEAAGTWKGKQTGGAGEWIMHDFKIPVGDYATMTAQFNPTQFNADAWVATAKAAGMRYIVMTAKHHEGFAMFHSLSDPFNIYDATQFKRDPIAEMSAACKKAGLKFGVYYSQAQDWHHAGGAAYGGHWDTAQDGSLDDYVHNVAAPQVKELLTRYKPAVLWWDTEVKMSDEDIRELTADFGADPGLIMNNRLGNGVPGDTETPEQSIPATGFPGRDWETCMTMNDTWGYKSFDNDFKTVPQLLHNLIDIASKGGNYLLNVGPEPTGVIPEVEVQHLKDMGVWLKANGESIYKTSASPFKKIGFDGRATVRGHTMYVNVFTWPGEGLTIKGLQTKVNSAKVVATGEKLTVSTGADGVVSISKPSQLDDISTAISLSLAGDPVVTEPEYLVTARPDGSYRLNAIDAILEGSGIQTEGSGEDSNVGFWGNQGDKVAWKVNAATEGKYSVSIDYSCDPNTPESTFAIEVDGQPTGVTGTVEKTDSWHNYHTFKLDGTVSLSSGKHVIRVVPKSKPHEDVMNLRRIVLTPAS